MLVASIFCVPHRVQGFGRMNAFQAFARLGELLSFQQARLLWERVCGDRLPGRHPVRAECGTGDYPPVSGSGG